MQITDIQLRQIVRASQKQLGENATPEMVKYIVLKVVQKLTDETKAQQTLPKNSWPAGII